MSGPWVVVFVLAGGAAFGAWFAWRAQRRAQAALVLARAERDLARAQGQSEKEAALAAAQAEREAASSARNELLHARVQADAAARRAVTAEAALRDQALNLEAVVKARTEEVQVARANAEAEARSRGDFLSAMSHDLRTQLNGIIGAADLLLLSTLDIEQQECARLVRRSGDQLLAVVNDVLDLSGLESGQLTLSPRPFHLLPELQALLALHRPVALERGVLLDLEVLPFVPEHLVGDVDRLLQVVGNLVANAVKWTHQGRITVRVASRQDARGLHLEFEVADTGSGIDPARLPTLFEVYAPGPGAVVRQAGGANLGLALCARLVEVMGGRITVASTVGQGSSFHFDVKVVEGEAASSAVTSVDPAELASFGQGLKVLLAEDNPVNQVIVLRLLRALGCEATLAADGQEAVKAATATAFDLVLMDVLMPVMSGLDAARVLRAAHLERQPRIVALTASASASDRQACLAAGMDDYIPKPLRMSLLQEQLRRARLQR